MDNMTAQKFVHRYVRIQRLTPELEEMTGFSNEEVVRISARKVHPDTEMKPVGGLDRDVNPKYQVRSPLYATDDWRLAVMGMDESFYYIEKAPVGELPYLAGRIRVPFVKKRYQVIEPTRIKKLQVQL